MTNRRPSKSVERCLQRILFAIPLTRYIWRPFSRGQLRFNYRLRLPANESCWYLHSPSSLSVWRYRPIFHVFQACLNLHYKHPWMFLRQGSSGFCVHWGTNTEETQTYINSVSRIQTHSRSIQDSTLLTPRTNRHKCTKKLKAVTQCDAVHPTTSTRSQFLSQS